MLKPVLPSPAERWKGRNPGQHASFPLWEFCSSPSIHVADDSMWLFRYQENFCRLLEAAADSCTVIG
jgi:hypothetical protein